MKPYPLRAAFAIVFAVGSSIVAGVPQEGHVSHGQRALRTTDGLTVPVIVPEAATAPPVAPDGTTVPPVTNDSLPLLVRPSMLAAQIEELAGHSVRVLYARVVGVFNPRAFLIDTSTRLPPVTGHRARVLVLVERGGLGVPAPSLVASTVTIAGVARTLLGMQVSREVPWPSELRPELVERLEIRAGVLATSVRTADGIEVTTRAETPR
jgi:hypothetical protein